MIENLRAQVRVPFTVPVPWLWRNETAHFGSIDEIVPVLKHNTEQSVLSYECP
jgi:hypothetical protein